MVEIKAVCLRNVRDEDIELVRSWWADGRVMKAVGFPLGLVATKEEVLTSIAKHQTGAFSDYLIIEDEQKQAIGEFHYRQLRPTTATLGIKIGNYASQGRGYGKAAILKGLELIQRNPVLRHVEIQVAADNTKALKLYEAVGFIVINKVENNWTDQLGQLRSTVVLSLEL